MSDPGYIGMLCVLWGLVVAVAGGYLINLAREITYVTLADGRRQERSLPLLIRCFLPYSGVVGLWAMGKGRGASVLPKIERKITAAGLEGLVEAVEVAGMSLLMPLCLGPFWVMMVMGMALSVPSLEQGRGLLILAGLLGLAWYPSAWLKQAMEERHRQVRRSLPFVLDLLTLSVEAGMDFMTALQRSVESRKLDALGEEFVRVIREIQVGKTRREALRDMSGRVGLSDLRVVVAAMVQADEFGVGMGSTLRILSAQTRQRRFEHAERQANEAPVKMLFPLVLFIFPSVFIILLGPVIMRLMQVL